MLNPDQSINHFRIIKKIGEGGMGEVYLAEDQKLSRQVALKVLPFDLSDDSDRLERFAREARTAAKISHPNVMSIYDFGTGRPEGENRDLNYIVMEYIKGQSLKEYLVGRNLTISERLKLSEKIARGLSAAHKLNIVHRDIKTDNIMIDAEGEPKILDFGLAKPFESVFSNESSDSVTASQDLTQDGKILGTVTYMSPEQARGEAVDARSDIFSFGIMMYKIFSGEYPFEGGDRISTIAKILEVKHTPIREKNNTLPPELERVIDKCLQKSPDDRYQDSRDLVVDLRALRRQYESGISESKSIEMESIKAKRNHISILKYWKVAASLAALILIIFLITNFINKPESSSTGALRAKENSLAILEFENKTGDAELDWLTAGLPEIMLTDLAQSESGNIISRNRVLDYLGKEPGAQVEAPGHQDCVEAAGSLGASMALSGAYYKLGDKIRIDARLEDVETGKILFGEKVIGTDPFILVDSLTQKIAKSLNSKELMSNNVGVADITSSSPEAYKYYIIGMEKYNKSLYDEAKISFEKAIEIDSTFALPYMRIGMGFALQNRGQLGAPYFEIAQRFQDRLPIRDKSMLDVYTSVWLEASWDEAIVKLKSFVANYPDDKEARSFYAILLSVLKRDSQAALTQLDTVIMLDSRFMLALEMYIQIYSVRQEFDTAIIYARRIKEYYPDLPESYRILADMYHQLARHDEAIEINKEFLSKFPGNGEALTSLVDLHILKRDFNNAVFYLERIPEEHPNDSYLMVDYYNQRANLDIWTGKFKVGLDNLKSAVQSALLTTDSMQICGQYAKVANYFGKFGLIDSAIVYSEKGNRWATKFMTLNYPLTLIQFGPEYEKQARPLLDNALKYFKANVPEEMWGMADLIEANFNAHISADTGKLIEIERKLMTEFDQDNTGSRDDLGRYLILTGNFKEGLEVMARNISGVDETSQGFYYLRGLYYTGMANESLGHFAEAISNYEEILKYWNNPDIELDLIADTRQRLARLRT